MPREMPCEYFGQRGGFVGRRGFCCQRRRPFRGGSVRAVRRFRGEYRAQQISRSFGARHHALRKADAEAALYAQEKLDAPEAVEAEVALQAMIERGGQ